MNFRPQRHRGNAVLEMTSMVDIVFILLLFFLLTATYVKNPNIDINLPEASLNKSAENKKDLDISIKDNGEIRYDNKITTIEALEKILVSEYAKNKESVVVIRADKSSTHGRVVDVMDLAKRIGFEKLAIAVQAKTGE